MAKTLVAFYSRADENYVNGMIKTLEVGNTQIAAEFIKDIVDCDLFKIEQIKPYSKDYNECIAQAQSDQRRDARPKLKNYLSGIEDYDTIILGYPNYWGTMPMALFTFLEHYNFKGKTIYPLCTHEGSGMGKSVGDIKNICTTANIGKSLAIQGAKIKTSKSDIEKWLKEINL
jgi:flavodoxin